MLRIDHTGISPLQSLRHLKNLCLTFDATAAPHDALTPLSGLSSLTRLNMIFKSISPPPTSLPDLSPLFRLTSLRDMEFDNMGSCSAPLPLPSSASLPNLTSLALIGLNCSELTSLCFVSSLTNLKKLTVIYCSARHLDLSHLHALIHDHVLLVGNYFDEATTAAIASRFPQALQDTAAHPSPVS